MSDSTRQQTVFQIIHQFNTAPQWHKQLLICGPLLTRCHDLEPLSSRMMLRQFWEREAIKLGIDRTKWKTWD